MEVLSAQALVAYDCGTPQNNVSTFSLLDVGECKVPESKIEEFPVNIQLIQYVDFANIEVVQCKIEIIREIKNCGWFSHVTLAHEGLASYIHEVSHEACLEMHRKQELTFKNDVKLEKLVINGTTEHSVTLAGTIDGDSCTGAAYKDPYGSWNKVVVSATIAVTLTQYTAAINWDRNEVILRSKTACEFTKRTCMDPEGGSTFWQFRYSDTCRRDRYGLVYEGPATLLVNSEKPQTSERVYYFESKDISFALKITEERTVCGYVLKDTVHPRLVIHETQHENYRFLSDTNKIHVRQIDILTYMNSKFLYIIHHTIKNFKNLYVNVMTQMCKVEQDVLRNLLSIAHNQPDEFAYNLLKGPGYIATVSGEVVYVMKCIPTEVALRHTDECFSQLPVSRNNESFFITPKSHVLLKHADEVSCDTQTPAMYLVNQVWYKMLPKLVESVPPSTLEPNIKFNWRPSTPDNVASSGIYTRDQLDKIRDQIMFPQERAAIINNIVRQATGMPVHQQSISFASLLDELALKKIADETWNKVWNGFLNFGTFSAGVLGIMIIARFIRLLVDTIVHGYTLHTVYGWSLHMLGALFGSITHLLVHMGSNRSKEPDPEANNLAEENQQNLSPIYQIPSSNQPLSRTTETYRTMMEANKYFRPNYWEEITKPTAPDNCYNSLPKK